MLTKDDVLNMHKSLADALHSYSTSTEPEDSGCCAVNQPNRLSIPLKNGATTLFMPATADNGLGVKVVTLAEGKKAPPSQESFDLPRRFNTGGSSVSATPSSPRSSSPSIYKRSKSPSVASVASSGARPSTSNSSSNVAASSGDSSLPPPLRNATHASAAATDTSPSGTLTLFTMTGAPRAVMSASTLTAFRTALASTMLLKRRRHAHTVTVFGAGKQAYWHILLTLILRGSEVHHVHLVNRTFERASNLYANLASHRSPLIQELWLTNKLRPTILTPVSGEYNRLLKEYVRSADVIFCCTPSTEPLFPAGHLTNTEGRRKARYIAAIGSYKPHMQELPVEVLHQAVRGPEEHKSRGPFSIHRHTAGEGGAVVVDSIEGAMREAGEIIRSGIGGAGIVELGELVMLKRNHWAEKAEREEKERGRRDIEEPGSPGPHKPHGLGHFFGLSGKHEEDAGETPKGTRSKSHGPRDSTSSIASSSSKEPRPLSSSGQGHGHHRSKSFGQKDKEKDKEMIVDDDGGLQQWLQRGNVIYKSVGIGLMDIVVGLAIVELAESRGIGASFDEF